MSTFILMTKLAPDVARKVRERKHLGREWLEQVHERCPEVKFVAHYALLGPYDFMDIFEAPNEEAAAKVSLISQENGAQLAESWTAMPYNRFLHLIHEMG